MITDKIKFEHRSVVQNDNSFFLCLPKVWAEHILLKRAELMTVEWNKEDDSLIIRREVRHDRTGEEFGEGTTLKCAVNTEVLERTS